MSDDMQEKFVADDGVSTVPDTVTPEGGEIKPKKADLKKKVDPTPEKVSGKMAEESETDETTEIVEEEVISIDESISSMFEGMELSEDFKSKVTMVFEAAVNEAATTKANEIAAELEESFEKQLDESLDSAIEEIVENVDSYLDYVVNEWMEENELAIETGIKVEMAESLMNGLKELFTEHNIEIDEETVDVVAGLEEENEELKNQVNESINDNIELSKEIAALKAEKVFNEATQDLTVSQAERLRTLSEKLDVSDIEAYSADLETLKESFFKKSKTTITEDTTDEEEIITEEETVKKPSSQYPTVNALVEALNARNAK